MEKIKTNFSLKLFFRECISWGFISDQDSEAIADSFHETLFPLLDADKIASIVGQLSEMISCHWAGENRMMELRAKYSIRELAQSWLDIDRYARIYRRGDNVKFVHAILLPLAMNQAERSA